MKFPVDILQNCWFLAGPTAVGKSELAIRLAEELDGEILSLDSMAIYRQMNIGTAKPTQEQQNRVPHHLIDLIDPDGEFSTAEYLVNAVNVSREVMNRGKTPVFVGGTGLYLRALLRGVFEGPPADWEFRNELKERAETEGPNWLHSQLSNVDPVSAERLHPNDHRRLIRALEIHHLTGQPASLIQNEQPLPEEERPSHVYWLSPDREWLRDRIDTRVEFMIESGLMAEVQNLLQRDPPIGRTARQALGYREMIDFLEGRCESLDETIEKIQTGTRQFAKRQHTWFRNLVECRPLERRPEDTDIDLLQRILSS
ncbi:tRNA dimethylallyltransferase [Thalassoglobus neptunius]|uniref:tRNA dimethylallyltransferase n=1 Tax=Thalassoglobus neptunius TaxID=1938619 RepID=A0A5C5WGL7_9PLAN|nr:tRNA (adenosine(37)-N6)-dimethylallyltransferase MiaA [Thalassoglobus neptunius]TWT49800.1 tRNA dimethylallyltransferase [Thalassoglobus neptunius]